MMNHQIAVTQLVKTGPILGTKTRHLNVNTITRKRRKSINISTRVTSTNKNVISENTKKMRLRMANPSRKSRKLRTNF